jgi:nicotinamidase-related amidase
MEQGLSLGIDRVEDGIVVNIRRSAIVIDTETIFMSTDFESSVRNPGINTPMFTGIAIELGIKSNARESLNREFNSVVVADAV